MVPLLGLSSQPDLPIFSVALDNSGEGIIGGICRSKNITKIYAKACFYLLSRMIFTPNCSQREKISSAPNLSTHIPRVACGSKDFL